VLEWALSFKSCFIIKIPSDDMARYGKEVVKNTYPKNISAVKKGEVKKVQVTERPKDVISL